MGKKVRFKILKKKYPNVCILFQDKKCITTYAFEKAIGTSEKELIKKSVSYLIIDNLAIIKRKEFQNNCYCTVLYQKIMKNILCEIGRKME